MLFVNAAQALPQAFQATYKVAKGGLTLGSMTSSLSYTGKQYHYHKLSQTSGLAALLSGDKIVENVDGIFNGEYLQPRDYLFHHTSKRKNRQDKAHFNSPKVVSGQYKDKKYKLDIAPGTLDRATLELALSRDMAKGQKQLNYKVVQRGKLDNYSFVRQGVEKITVPAGTYECEKVMVGHKDKKRQTVFWLAKKLGYIPVKIDHTEKGSSIVTVMKSYRKR
jgi:hypothetical protein